MSHTNNRRFWPELNPSMALKRCTKLDVAWKRCPIVFSCDQAALQMVFSVRPSVRPSVCPSVCLSVCPSVCHTFLPEASYGLRVLSLPASVCVCVCVCMCVCVSVNHQFVRTITCHPLKLQSPNLDQKCKTPWLRSLLFLGFIDLDLQGQIELKSQNLPHFGLASLSGRQFNTKWSEAFQIWTKNAP